MIRPAGGATVRVCVVAPSLGILGGQAVQALRLVEHLNGADGLSVDLLPVNPRLPGLLGRLQAIKYVRTVLTSISYIASLLGNLRRYDVIHVFSASYWSFLLAPLPAMVIGRLYGKKVVLNYHSGEADDHLTRSAFAVRAIGLAHEVVVPSHYLLEVFGRFGIRARAIFNFVDVERIPYRRRTRFAPRLLTNRNLEPIYNVACALRAFARVQAELPEATLVVAGFGSQRAPLESLAAELRLRNVSFVGRVPADQMGPLYNAADLFLNASNIDNMPLSILDAFAAGVPVVTTDAGGIPYMVDDGRTGLVVRREDDTALAGAALRLLRDETLAARIADAARAECLAHYVWPVVGEQWLSLFRSLAGPTGRLATAAADAGLAARE
jgi:glycosyltransferase involved in cell wall biosynthesis